MDSIVHIANTIKYEGFAFIKQWQPSLCTRELAGQVGSILEIEKQLPDSGIGTIQKLKPRKPSDEFRNQYSGIYGLDEFPFHSDLAHWFIPPRYLMLRCIRGSKDVTTNLLPFSSFERKFRENVLKFALVAPRRKNKSQTICPMPVKFKGLENDGVRWDLTFLQPLNDSAREAYQIMSTTSWNDEMISVCLENAGDTLIIDNWKMLHNRSLVPLSSQNREIERVYLTRLDEK